MDGLPESTVLAMFGLPAIEERMPRTDSRLWIYDRPTDLRFRNFVRVDWDAGASIIVEPALVTGQTSSRRKRSGLQGGFAIPAGKMFFTRLHGPSTADTLEV